VENSLWGAIDNTVAACLVKLRCGSKKPLTCELRKLKEHHADIQQNMATAIITHPASWNQQVVNYERENQIRRT
jgi:hypothetical protein